MDMPPITPSAPPGHSLSRRFSAAFIGVVACILLGFALLAIVVNLTQLDATGPAQVLARVPGATVHMIWKTRDPIPTDAGFSIVPNTTFADCPKLDVICVPGGYGQTALMTDDETLEFLRKQAATARYVTSVCTGSLVLGAAGLLKGYRSACHWAWREMLSDFGNG